MANYKSYIHVERLGKEETEGLLDGTVYVFPKIDGTNSSVYFDSKNNIVGAGSRNRKITPSKDNASFAKWVYEAQDEEIKNIRTLVEENKNLIVYGEWLGTSKFVGSIKDYTDNTRNTLWIFDIFDTEKERYLTYEQMKEILEQYALINWMIPLLAKIENPTEEQLLEIARNNRFLLKEDAELPGEGIVIHNYDFIDNWGHYQVGKLVLERKNKNQKKNNTAEPGMIENEIVNMYLTDEELEKNKAKTITKFNLDRFETNQKNCVGYYLSLCYRETILDETKDFVKRFKNPVIDFALLMKLSNDKARKYIGLG